MNAPAVEYPDTEASVPRKPAPVGEIGLPAWKPAPEAKRVIEWPEPENKVIPIGQADKITDEI